MKSLFLIFLFFLSTGVKAAEPPPLMVDDIKYLDGDWYDRVHDVKITVTNGVAKVTKLATKSSSYKDRGISEGTVIGEWIAFKPDEKMHRASGNCWDQLPFPKYPNWGLQPCEQYNFTLYIPYVSGKKKLVPRITYVGNDFLRKEDIDKHTTRD